MILIWFRHCIATLGVFAILTAALPCSCVSATSIEHGRTSGSQTSERKTHGCCPTEHVPAHQSDESQTDSCCGNCNTVLLSSSDLISPIGLYVAKSYPLDYVVFVPLPVSAEYAAIAGMARAGPPGIPPRAVSSLLTSRQLSRWLL